MATVQTPVDLHDVEQFLYREARLIDERKFDDWLALFTDDALYWAPANRNNIDPTREVSLIYDDRRRMGDRIWRLQSGMAHSQDPASKTRHLISNVEVIEATENEVTVSSCFAIFELRRGVQKTYAGRYEHHLRRVDGSWKIAFKKAELLNNDEPIDNLTFLV